MVVNGVSAVKQKCSWCCCDIYEDDLVAIDLFADEMVYCGIECYNAYENYIYGLATGREESIIWQEQVEKHLTK